MPPRRTASAASSSSNSSTSSAAGASATPAKRASAAKTSQTPARTASKNKDNSAKKQAAPAAAGGGDDEEQSKRERSVNNQSVDAAAANKEQEDVYRDPRNAAAEHRYQYVHNPQDHDVRKRMILEKYGDEVRKLMVIEPRTKWDVMLLVGLQLLASVLFYDSNWWVFVGMAYLCGTSMTHALFLAIHEVTHYTVFKTAWMNSALAMVANIPIVFPYAMMFRDYHADHHRYLGWESVDTDLPTEFERKLLDSFPGRLFFLTFQIFFYALRPMLVMFKPMRIDHWVNWAVVFGFDVLWCAIWQSYWPVVFLALSLALSGAISPTSGHFVSEHYTVWSPSKRQETFSYYGAWNFFTFNVGYHNEHHDFPNIPWTKLPELRRIAPEFYDPLVQPPSWFATSMQFLFNGEIGIYNRVKREHNARQRPNLTLTDKEVNPDLEPIISAAQQAKFSKAL